MSERHGILPKRMRTKKRSQRYKKKRHPDSDYLDHKYDLYRKERNKEGKNERVFLEED